MPANEAVTGGMEAGKGCRDGGGRDGMREEEGWDRRMYGSRTGGRDKEWNGI